MGEICLEYYVLLSLHVQLPMTNIMTLSHSFSGIDQLLQPKITEDVEIVDDQEDTHAIAAYYAADSNLVDDESRFERIFFEPTRRGNHYGRNHYRTAVEGSVNVLTEISTQTIFGICSSYFVYVNMIIMSRTVNGMRR